jgi:hypothetical protein
MLLFLSAAFAGLDGAVREYRPDAVNDQVITMSSLIVPVPDVRRILMAFAALRDRCRRC